MKRLLQLLSLILISSWAQTVKAQQSCSFIIHVDGDNGTDDVNCGAEGTPCATINYGIQRASTEGYADVRITVSTNPYSEIVEVADGISLWGGFDSQWSLVGQSVIEGGLDNNNEVYTITASNINASTVLSDLVVNAPNATIAGKSSYGIHVANSTGLTLQRVTVNGGTGAQGNNGTAGTDATIAGIDGADGQDGDEFNTSCNDGDSGDGGTGATTPGFANTKGGNGGRGGYMDDDCSFPPDLDATGGIAGGNATVFQTNGYGYRGGGGGTCNDGSNGQNGLTVHGTGGSGATSPATLTGNFWTATNADTGTLGENGTGGGGGGGSGGCDDGTDSYGAGGGGGGSGGIAASSAGTGGQSGGNSAALFLVNSTCSAVDCSFLLGSGGVGGTGGISGQGTAGGQGGDGGNGPGTGDGGNGGNGGNGGHSGGGGGGAAGSAYGIYGVNSTINQSGSSFNGGSAGVVGTGGSAIPTGVAGSNGAAGSVTFVAGTITDNTGMLALEPDPCVEIVTADLSTLEYCAGESTTINFSAVGTFIGTNVFTVQLSDATGDFTSPTDIGSIVSSTPGAIVVTFPEITPQGSGYRVRVTSTASPTTGTENPTDIVINALPTVVANASSTNVCAGSEVTLTGSGADSYLWSGGVSDGISFIPTTTGYFTVLGTDNSTQCFNFDSVLVTVVGLPDTSVAQNGNQLAAVLAGATYQWLDCDDNFSPVINEANQTFVASNSGNYAVTVTLNGCADTSSCYNVMTVGLEETSEETVLLLYPNPSNGIFQMISNVENPMEVTVFNMIGQTVYSKSNITNNSVINIEGVESGLYSIRFHNEELNLLRQVIITK